MIRVLTTEHLIIRKAVPGDLEAIWNNVWRDGEIAASMLWQVTETLPDAVTRLERTIRYQSSNNAFFVCLKETDIPIGFAGVRPEGDGVWEESGICIGKQWQGRGYAKEVIAALKELVFLHLGGNRCIYGCFSDNTRSRNAALSQGFIYFESRPGVRDYDGYEYVCDYYYFDLDMYLREAEKASPYVCKVASREEIEVKYDETYRTITKERDVFEAWKERAVSNFLSERVLTYVGLLNGEFICECAAGLDPDSINEGYRLIDEKTAYLSSFRTREEYRRKGYFSKLFRFVLRDLYMRGYRRVSVGVDPDETYNLAVYRHFGFSEKMFEGIHRFSNGREKTVEYYSMDIPEDICEGR